MIYSQRLKGFLLGLELHEYSDDKQKQTVANADKTGQINSEQIDRKRKHSAPIADKSVAWYSLNEESILVHGNHLQLKFGTDPDSTSAEAQTAPLKPVVEETKLENPLLYNRMEAPNNETSEPIHVLEDRLENKMVYSCEFILIISLIVGFFLFQICKVLVADYGVTTFDLLWPSIVSYIGNNCMMFVIVDIVLQFKALIYDKDNRVHWNFHFKETLFFIAVTVALFALNAESNKNDHDKNLTVKQIMSVINWSLYSLPALLIFNKLIDLKCVVQTIFEFLYQTIVNEPRTNVHMQVTSHDVATDASGRQFEENVAFVSEVLTANTFILVHLTFLFTVLAYLSLLIFCLTLGATLYQIIYIKSDIPYILYLNICNFTVQYFSISLVCCYNDGYLKLEKVHKYLNPATGKEEYKQGVRVHPYFYVRIYGYGKINTKWLNGLIFSGVVYILGIVMGFIYK